MHIGTFSVRVHLTLNTAFGLLLTRPVIMVPVVPTLWTLLVKYFLGFVLLTRSVNCGPNSIPLRLLSTPLKCLTSVARLGLKNGLVIQKLHRPLLSTALSYSVVVLNISCHPYPTDKGLHREHHHGTIANDHVCRFSTDVSCYPCLCLYR